MAHPKRESWVLLGFKPSTEDEVQRLNQARQLLGFDPTIQSHELTANDRDPDSKKSAKKILKLLIGEDKDRDQKCWHDADLAELIAKGVPSGLADYMRQIQQFIVPFFNPALPRLR